MRNSVGRSRWYRVITVSRYKRAVVVDRAQLFNIWTFQIASNAELCPWFRGELTLFSPKQSSAVAKVMRVATSIAEYRESVEVGSSLFRSTVLAARPSVSDNTSAIYYHLDESVINVVGSGGFMSMDVRFQFPVVSEL